MLKTAGGNTRFRLALAGVAACSLAGLALGKQAQTEAEPHAKLELIAEPTAAGKPMWMGVLFRLDPGWHVYWKNAGDSGEPPKITWKLPEGFHAGEIQWPTPMRIGSGTVIDYGYEEQVLLMAPVERGPGITAGAAGASAIDGIVADVRYVVCAEICIPGKAQLKMTAGEDEKQTSELFRQTRAALPRKLPTAWHVNVSQDREHFLLTIDTGSKYWTGTFFPIDPGVVENSGPQTVQHVAGAIQLKVKKSEILSKPVSRLRGLIQTAPGRSYEIDLPVGMMPGASAADSKS